MAHLSGVDDSGQLLPLDCSKCCWCWGRSASWGRAPSRLYSVSRLVCSPEAGWYSCFSSSLGFMSSVREARDTPATVLREAEAEAPHAA